MLNELRARLRADLRPEGTLEDVLVDRIVASIWRLRRLGRVEMGLSLSVGIATRLRARSPTRPS